MAGAERTPIPNTLKSGSRTRATREEQKQAPEAQKQAKAEIDHLAPTRKLNQDLSDTAARIRVPNGG